MAVPANLASGGASWRVLCAPRSGFEGGGVVVSCSATARVRTRGWCRREALRGYSSWRGGVPSPHASTTSGMAMQWSGWRRDGRDGRTGPMVTEVTAPVGLTSRRRPVRSWSSHESSLRGLYRPFSRVRCAGRTGVGGIVPRGSCWPCRTAAHSGGDGLAKRVGGAVPGRDSQARSCADSPLTWAPADVSALNAPAGGAGMEAAGP
jgi:hypothetical protein